MARRSLEAQAVRRASVYSMDGEAMMNKFNNTLEGTDCGNAGLPAHSCDVAKPKTVLRVIPKTPHNALRARCDRTRQKDRKNGVVVLVRPD